MRFRPPLFLVTGLFWLIFSSLLGLLLFLGMVWGMPLPPALRLVHVHGALIGGVAQIIFGAMLAFIPPLLMTGRNRPESHGTAYGAINLGTIGVLTGFWLGYRPLIAGSGLLIILAFVSLLTEAIRQVRSSLVRPPLNLWFYGVALLVLLTGLGLGEGLALRMIPQQFLGQVRLGHIHLNLLGFVTLTIVGTMHNLFPTVLQTPLYSPRLARLTFYFLPLGILLLVIGFLLSLLPVELAGGCVTLAGALLYGYNILRTWLKAGRPRTTVAEHLLLATFFLVIGVIAGLLVTVNALWDPPAVPFGTLHLVAYTHLALIGFIFQTIIGALSHLLPISLTVIRVASNKKRGPYLESLTRLIEQWRPLQVGAFNLGTIGLPLVATLVWQFNLSSRPVQIAAYVSIGLLGVGVILFAVKVVALLASRPEPPSKDS